MSPSQPFRNKTIIIFSQSNVTLQVIPIQINDRVGKGVIYFNFDSMFYLECIGAFRTQKKNLRWSVLVVNYFYKQLDHGCLKGF